jgi:acyl dehydratase
MITSDTPVGQEFSGKPKKYTWERIAAFSGGPFRTPGWPHRNIHTDLEFARSTGLSVLYVSGTQSEGHIAELMIDLFGEGWLKGGQTKGLKFIKPVAEGDVIRVGARVQSRQWEGTALKVTVDIWCENQYGEKVLVGAATGTVE